MTEYFENYMPDKAFQNNSYIDTLICLPTLKMIGSHAFDGCIHLKLFDASSSTVLENAFQCCTSLHKFNFAETTFIDRYAFESSGIVEANLKSVQVLSKFAFASCFDLRHLTLGNLVEINESVFSGCSFDKLIIPESVKTIKSKAFCDNIYLNDVVFVGRDVPEIAPDAFANCAIRNVWLFNRERMDEYKQRLPKPLNTKIKEIEYSSDLLHLL